ncbi:metallophosphoesterase (plasmid) [Pseudomonas sp. HR96]|uniref:metallophosphoesterase family protein n=1 Tax=Pseudomonas sp. HR96 TaxID=1027966 RepID=UPI002A74A7B6|nr:metallophosphoesterase [Pseudomonas sp. HR96]WPP02404.1 metallophosphoesterase [Pseudomonas sp. HR96]
MIDRKFGWLHISDHHIGANGTKHLWPQVREEILNDVKNHVLSGNSVDIVIFSGDLVQQGEKAEYEKAKLEIRNIFEALNSVGSNPKFFIVPGNHDLKRVEDGSSLPLAIEKAGERVEMYKKTFLNASSDNQKLIRKAFKNYTAFVNSLRQDNIPLLESTVVGVMPGEIAGTLDVNGLKIGLIGLNSTWSQVQGGNYKGKIEIFTEQFTELTGNNPGEWAAAHDFNILVTHHPANWLSSKSKVEFDNQIFISKYFALHLYGHMHEISTVAIDHGDGHIRRSVQAASLFGMDRANGELQRNHGYIFGQIIDESQLLRIWPRKVESLPGRGWKVSPDTRRIPGDGLFVEYPFNYSINGSSKKK